ncbi:MAG: CDF family Co(II)/Ni(II) efflux transporter DmeF [Methylococcaceae bacterium]|jgi:cation diffusion facilitator family transporter
MHTKTLAELKHSHEFARINQKAERRTRLVLVLTFFTMLLEITAGMGLGSMALLADGWHMATHVAAFMITLFAYRYSRIHADDSTFAFSPAKVSVLGGFASSVALGVVAFMMLAESAERFWLPHSIQFNEAIAVAVFGLLINLISALLLKEHHHHAEQGHDHDHHHHDHNLKAAYLHVMADALTSILAIIALVCAKYYGWNWLDPSMGIVGALVIGRWSLGLVKETSPVLLDETIDSEYEAAIRQKIEADADNRVADLHIWRLGPSHFALIASVVTDKPRPPEHYKALLKNFPKLSHITVEVNQCPGNGCQ